MTRDQLLAMSTVARSHAETYRDKAVMLRNKKLHDLAVGVEISYAVAHLLFNMINAALEVTPDDKA